MTSASGGVAVIGPSLLRRPSTAVFEARHSAVRQSMPAARARTVIRCRSRVAMPRPASGRRRRPPPPPSRTAAAGYIARSRRRPPGCHRGQGLVVAVASWASCERVRSSSTATLPRKPACRVSGPSSSNHEAIAVTSPVASGRTTMAEPSRRITRFSSDPAAPACRPSWPQPGVSQ